MFENILGNEKIKEDLTIAVKKEKILHSYMFIGTEGIGKMKIAVEFAKMILCLEPEKYCGNCKSCLELDGKNHPDFQILESEGNNIKIEQIRLMQEKIYERPIVSNKNVYIINDADTMTKEAQNCLLKTLEEPPNNTVIMLVGKNENQFLTTIKSRCMVLQFEKISNEIIKKYLEDNYQMNNLTDDILELFQGSIKKAIHLKDKKEQYESIKIGLSNIGCSQVQLIKSLDMLYTAKEEVHDILDYISVILMQKIKENIQYANCIKIVEDTRKRIIGNNNYEMAIDNMVFKIWEEIN